MSKSILQALGKIDLALGGQTDDAVNVIDALNQISDSVGALKTSVDDINSMEIKILSDDEYNSETGVPTVENPVKGTFYLTPAKNEEDNNMFNEYYINDDGEWEMFGSASIDVNSLFDLSDRMAKGVDNNGNVVTGAIIEGSIDGKYKNKASGNYSHAEGSRTIASGSYSHAEGGGTTASGIQSHAEGSGTTASGNWSHAESSNTTASGESAHAEGASTTASGNYSHAEGLNTIASGTHSHTEGANTTASGNYSHAQGLYTTANHKSQHVFGEYNAADTSTAAATARGNYIEIVGNGTSSSAKSNARTLDWSGNEVLAGKLTVGTGPTENMDVATKQYVDENSGGLQNLVDGSASGSVRGIGAAAEDSSYTMGQNAVAIGVMTKASGGYSYAEGVMTTASGVQSHAEGFQTIASGSQSHAEGNGTKATSSYSHAEGNGAIASGDSSHAEGGVAIASGNFSHAEGGGTTASGNYSHAEGSATIASGNYSHASGYYTVASGKCAYAEGNYVDLSESNLEYLQMKLTGNANTLTYTYDELPYDVEIKANNQYFINNKLVTVTELNTTNNTIAINETLNTSNWTNQTVTVIAPTIASEQNAHAEGHNTTASGYASHTEGDYTTASGNCSHAEGVSTTASGAKSHAEGVDTTASGQCSHAEGSDTTASGDWSHAEGYGTTASGDHSHTEGSYTTASGMYSHAEGDSTTASGWYSHAEGEGTIANHQSQHVFGAYNVEDSSAASAGDKGKYIEIVGNGTSDSYKSNARTLDWIGNESLQGSLTLGKGTADETTITAAQLKSLLALLNA